VNSEPPRWFPRALLLVIALAVLIRLFYWFYTDRTWEDALITVLHSENAARGLGLTHLVPPGEGPLHGFTSPLSVLIPLVGDVARVGFGLSFLKLVSALCGGIAVWLGARICLNMGVPPALTLTAAAYLALECQQILYGMAGMETQVAVVAYLYSIYCVQRGTQWQKGFSLGFVMLARPDGAIWVALVFAVELWRARKTGSWRGLVPVAGGLTLLYAPWLIFTTLYYGSPVPNTIIAKSLGYSGMVLDGRIRSLIGKFLSIFRPLGPAYTGNGVGVPTFWDHGSIYLLALALFLLGALAAFRKRDVEALPVFLFLGAYSFYLTLGAPVIFGWYAVPVTAVAVIASCYGLWQILERFVAQPARERVMWVAGVVYIASLVLILPTTMRSDKYLQLYVEDRGRAEVGRYLHSVSTDKDTIGLEPLGYVGYYSRRLIYDYPGLCSRRVVRYLRDHPQGHSLIAMLSTLRPTFLVLRPREYLTADGRIRYPWIEQDYKLVRVFRVPDEDRQKIPLHEGNIDFEFDVFRSKNSPEM
jgi:hypothetical protein